MLVVTVQCDVHARKRAKEQLERVARMAIETESEGRWKKIEGTNRDVARAGRLPKSSRKSVKKRNKTREDTIEYPARLMEIDPCRMTMWYLMHQT